MAFLQGTQPLASDTQDVVVVFEAPFAATPQILIPVVSNVSADTIKFLIEAVVVAKTQNGFTVRLSAAPNTTNYTLDWVAGDPTTMYQLTSTTGVKVTQLPQLASLPQDPDRIMVTQMAPVPITYTMTWELFRHAFPNLIADAPPTRVSAGVAGQVAWDGDYLYTHDGVQWGRTARDTESW